MAVHRLRLPKHCNSANTDYPPHRSAVEWEPGDISPFRVLPDVAPMRRAYRDREGLRVGLQQTRLLWAPTVAANDPNQTLRSPKGLPLALPGTRQRRPARVPRA